MTFSALARARLLALAADGGSPRTGKSYDEAYGMFVEYLHTQGLNDDVREFTPDTVEGFKVLLAGRCKASSVNNRLAALASLGKWAMQHGQGKGHRYLASNPVDAVSRSKKVRPREKFLYREELTALQNIQAVPNERLVLDAFLDTGLRLSELAGACVRDLRPLGDALVLTVRLKGGRLKDIPLGPELSVQIEASLREREVSPEDPVFVNQSGAAYRKGTLCEAIYRLGRRAGITRIPVRPHVLRHTYNVYARAGAKLDVVQRASLLNHSDSSTIARYDHMLPDEEIEARAKVREVLRHG